MKKTKLGFWPQVALIFFTVSGGAYGLEALVGTVGAKWSLILVVVLPVLWAIPISLMVAELSAAIPEEGGYYIWVRRALGPFWGFQEGWWTLCYSAVDMTLYPVLFVTYLSYFVPALGTTEPHGQLLRWGVCAGFIFLALLFNIRGSKLVGMNALANLVIVSFPFALLSVWGVFNGDWHRLGQALATPLSRDISAANLAAGLAIILWNYSGWDNISTYAHEVENPQRNYPRAIAMALLIIVISYILPLLAGFKATVTPSDWINSSGWPSIAAKLGGPWLGTFGALTALLSAWAMFNSQLLYVSRLPAAMAKDGWLPKPLARTAKDGTPVIALVTIATVAAVISGLSLGKLVVMDILLYTLGLSLEFVALIVLRKNEPHLARPFRIPTKTFGLVVISVMPILLALVVGASSAMGTAGSYVQLGSILAAIISGIAIYAATARRHFWQPTLESASLHLRPMTEADFEPLYAVASDPLLWEQHPDRERHTRARFEIYFRSGIESRGALVILDRETRRIIGASRFSDPNDAASSVEIGYTFLERRAWGTPLNRELKALMLNHAFQRVDTVYFIVGIANHRSRKAMSKLGGELLSSLDGTPVQRDLSTSAVFRMTKSRWSTIQTSHQ